MEVGQEQVDVEAVVTGATTEVAVAVDRSPDEVWDVVTDVASIGRWSPETVEAHWLDGATGPEKGAVYAAHNRFPSGFESDVLCRVVEADRPHRYGWDVLDADAPDGPVLARWAYELEPGERPGQTLIRHVFTHGPGVTNVRLQARERPQDAAQVVADRLAELRRLMTTTLAAMFAGLP